MRRLTRLASIPFVLAVTVACALAKSDGSVGPGDMAPPLEVKKWFKGTPVTSLDPSKTYVVEFWATWCGPCKQTIPHLTELAKKNPDVTFIGVSIWEDDNGTSISKFVQDEGDQMDYNVGYSGNQTGMAASWMAAAGQNGIPTAFIVKQGKIQWVGHPMALEQPLAQVKAGTFDLKSFKSSFDASTAATRKQAADEKELDAIVKLYDAGNQASAKQKLHNLIAANPELAPSASKIRFRWLAKEDPAAWEKEARGMATTNKETLLGFAMAEAEPGGSPAQGKKAIEIALAATNSKDLETLYFATRYYMATKDFKSGLSVVNKALDVFPTSEMKDNAQLKEILLKMKKDVETGLAAKPAG